MGNDIFKYFTSQGQQRFSSILMLTQIVSCDYYELADIAAQQVKSRDCLKYIYILKLNQVKNKI